MCKKTREMMLDTVAKYKLRRIFDMAKYEIRDVHKAIDRLMGERFDLAAQAKTLLGEITDDNGRTVQIQLCLEARPEMFMPMEPEEAPSSFVKTMEDK